MNAYRELNVSIRVVSYTCDGCKAEWAPGANEVKEINRTGPDAGLTAIGVVPPAGWNGLRLGERKLDLCPTCTAQAILDRRNAQATAAAAARAAAQVVTVPAETPATAPVVAAAPVPAVALAAPAAEAAPSRRKRAQGDTATPANGAPEPAVTPDAVIPAGAPRE